MGYKRNKTKTKRQTKTQIGLSRNVKAQKQKQAKSQMLFAVERRVAAAAATLFKYDNSIWLFHDYRCAECGVLESARNW